ncbi:hypothetical protein K2P97_02785 [bacterium]|nr:hypothetical protein [bacterium]
MSKSIGILLYLILLASPAFSAATEKNYLSLNLPYPQYKEMLAQLINKVGPLKDRGEAHITIISPPEFKVLTDPKLSKMNARKITETYVALNKGVYRFKQVCIGSSEKNLNEKKLKTYYIVVDSPDLLAFRREISKLSQVPKSKFDPDLFYPHITLGFTEKDLHYEDGVIKDSKSCMKDIDIKL